MQDENSIEYRVRERESTKLAHSYSAGINVRKENTKKGAFVTEHWLKITGTMAHELPERRLYFTVICIFTILIILIILLFLIIIMPARDNRG